MPMCKVLSHSGGGEYSVEVLYNTETIADRMTDLTDWTSDPENISKLEDLQNAVVASQNNINVVTDELNVLIDELEGLDPELEKLEYSKKKKEIRKATIVGLEWRTENTEARQSYIEFQEEFITRNLEVTEINRLGTEPNQLLSVWCVDLADGIDGRAIYSAGQELELMVVRYDTEQYLLPPANVTLKTLFEYASINIPRHILRDSRAAMIYSAAAMEGGFAKWKPLILKGELRLRENDPTKDCGNPVDAKRKEEDDYEVFFEYATTRFGTEVGGFTARCKMNYFDGIGSFKTGDAVIVTTGEITANGLNGELTMVDGKIIGYASNPKILDDTNKNDPCPANDYDGLGYNCLTSTVGGLKHPPVSSQLNGFIDIESTGSYQAGELYIRSMDLKYSREAFTCYDETEVREFPTITTCSTRSQTHVGKYTSHKIISADGGYYAKIDSGQAYVQIGNIVIPQNRTTILYENGKQTQTRREVKVIWVCVSTGAYEIEVTTNVYGAGAFSQKTVHTVNVDCRGDETETAGYAVTGDSMPDYPQPDEVGDGQIYFAVFAAGMTVFDWKVPPNETDVKHNFGSSNTSEADSNFSARMSWYDSVTSC